MPSTSLPLAAALARRSSLAAASGPQVPSTSREVNGSRASQAASMRSPAAETWPCSTGTSAPSSARLSARHSSGRSSASSTWRSSGGGLRRLGRRGGPLETQQGREGRAAARLAGDPDIAAHGARQPARDGEPQARATLAPAYGGLCLLELAEQEGQGVGLDADAGVLHGDGDGNLVGGCRPAGFVLAADGDEDAARIRELDGVADEVGQDLPQAHLVAAHCLGQMGMHGPGDIDTLLVGLGRKQLHHALHAIGDDERLGFEHQPVGLDLGEVEDLVDQGEKLPRRAVDGARVGLLLRRYLGLAEQADHAEDAVHGRADLVAHGREEARLGAVGSLRLLPRVGELRPRAPGLGDVATDALHLGDRAFPGRNRVLLPLEPARAGGGLDLLHRAALAHLGAGCQRPDPVAGQNARLERLAEHGASLQPEHPAEGAVHEGKARRSRRAGG